MAIHHSIILVTIQLIMQNWSQSHSFPELILVFDKIITKAEYWISIINWLCSFFIRGSSYKAKLYSMNMLLTIEVNLDFFCIAAHAIVE